MKNHKPISFKIPKSVGHALLVQIDEGKKFYSKLHYHPEFQITAMRKGAGILYAGNRMTSFAENDVIVIGSNVPHLLECTELYQTDDSPGVLSTSLFFDEFSFGKQFFEIKEMKALRSLLSECNRVIKIDGEYKETIFDKIIQSESLKDDRLIINFLEILSLIRKSDISYVNDEGYNLILDNNEGGRLDKVLEFTFKNYKKEISIDQISKIAFLSRSQFSYFFKLHTGKTYIKFLTELRLENACILLKDRKFTVEQVCYEVGFKNISNFSRHFKKSKGMTPSQYRKLWDLI